TYVSIRTSDTSSNPHRPPSQAYRTLPYPTNVSLNRLDFVYALNKDIKNFIFYNVMELKLLFFAAVV
ncbi:hypothetical protein MJL33_29000, partial [Salmonella enterica subsp. enterica serovar Kentucky]|nr:hypothetical protein [Salmonella enterica subsp. enterica serovar Kentucky]